MFDFFFSKISRENSSFIKIGKQQWALYTKTNIHFCSYLAFLLRMKNVSEKSRSENRNKYFSSVIPPGKSCRLWDNVEKYCTALQATEDKMAYAHCMLDTLGHTHTHSEYVIDLLIVFPLQQRLHEHASRTRSCSFVLCTVNSSSRRVECSSQPVGRTVMHKLASYTRCVGNSYF